MKRRRNVRRRNGTAPSCPAPKCPSPSFQNPLICLIDSTPFFYDPCFLYNIHIRFFLVTLVSSNLIPRHKKIHFTYPRHWQEAEYWPRQTFAEYLIHEI